MNMFSKKKNYKKIIVTGKYAVEAPVTSWQTFIQIIFGPAFTPAFSLNSTKRPHSHISKRRRILNNRKIEI